MKKNSGFSLVELIVAIAVFVIAGAVIFGFASYSSNHYSRTNEDVKLQYEQQLAVNQIRDAILEASRGINYNDGTKCLYVYSEELDDSGTLTFPVTKITYDNIEQKIYMAKKVFASVSAINLAEISDSYLLAEDVSAFSVDLSRVKKDKVKILITFKVNQKEVTTAPVIALRNKLVVSEETDAIYSGSRKIINSFIEGIQIKRGSKTFAQGETDTISKVTASPVVVKYDAIVKAKSDSTREYTVNWSISPVITGISVDPVTGRVSVGNSVADGTTFTLTATSVDDPLKYTNILVRVDSEGAYPESLSITSVKEVGNGFWSFAITPTITYTNRTTKKDIKLVDWHGVDGLPEGASFEVDQDTNTLNLYLTSKVNGKTLEIYATTKETGVDGDVVVSNKIVIEAQGIPEYVSGPSIRLNTAATFDRGGVLNPSVTFANATHSDYTYYWTIEPYKDDSSYKWNDPWDTKTSFSNINLSNNRYSNYRHNGNVITCTTQKTYRTIAINCDTKLKWDKTFKIKINVYAVNNKNNKEVLYAEEQIASIPPVSLTLNPLGSVPSEGNFSTETTIKYVNHIRDCTRYFTPVFKGLYLNPTNNPMNSWTTAYTMKFYDMGGRQVYPDNWTYNGSQYTDRNAVGFVTQVSTWKQNWYSGAKPVTMEYWVTYSDRNGNSIMSEALPRYYFNYQ